MITFKQFILNEAILIPRQVFKSIQDYVVSVYKTVKANNIKKITTNQYPPKIFPIDFTGTSWEFLMEEFTPHVILTLNNTTTDSHFRKDNPDDPSDIRTIKNGWGWITLDLGDLQDILNNTIEHEMGHFLQYLIVSYKIRKKMIPDIPLTEFENYLGGMPAKRMIPKGITPRGYKEGEIKQWVLTTPEMQTQRQVYYIGRKMFKIRAKTAEEALYLARLKYPRAFLKPQTIAVPTINPSSRRLEHVKRPVEYYTNMLTFLRRLQDVYDKEPQGMSKSEYFKGLIKYDPKLFINTKHQHILDRIFNFILAMKKNTTPELYNRVLSRLYNLFVNTDTKFENEHIRNIVSNTIMEISKVIAQRERERIRGN